MASIEKRGDGQYRAKIRRNGHNLSKTFERQQDAKDWASMVESEIRRGIFVDRSEIESTTLGEALERYKAEIAPSLKSRVSLCARLNAWLKSPLSKRSLASLKGADFSAFARERLSQGIKPDTIRRDLMVVMAVLAAAKDDWNMPIDSSFMKPVLKKLQQSPGRERRLSKTEETSLLQHASDYSADAHACIVLAIETGMRRSELQALEWSQIDYEAKVIKLRHGETKNAEGRIIPITAKAEHLLKALPRHLSGKVIASYSRADSISQMFTRVCKRAGITDLRFHDLRHETASRLAPYVTLTNLAKIMGWKNVEMAMRYHNPTANDLVSAVRNAESCRLAA